MTIALPREDSAAGLVHPVFLPDGRCRMVDHDIVVKIERGDPVKGWEGDPRLAVYLNAETDRWELWRFEHDGEYRLVCRSRPGLPFDGRVIDHLIQHDTRRGFNAKQHVDKANAAAERRRASDNDARDEQNAEKLRWALKRDGADAYL